MDLSKEDDSLKVPQNLLFIYQGLLDKKLIEKISYIDYSKYYDIINNKEDEENEETNNEEEENKENEDTKKEEEKNEDNEERKEEEKINEDNEEIDNDTLNKLDDKQNLLK